MKDKNKRAAVLVVRLTLAEKREISDFAACVGGTMSQFLRVLVSRFAGKSLYGQDKEVAFAMAVMNKRAKEVVVNGLSASQSSFLDRGVK